MGFLSKAFGSVAGKILGDSGSFLSNTFDNALSMAGNIPGGDYLSAAASLYGGISANNANAKQASLNRSFQSDLSNTAYQRATADMRAAGLNPMLAYSQGGASTPTGATATMQDVVTPALSTARQTSRLTQEMQNMKAQNALTWENTNNVNADTGLKEVQKDKAYAEKILAITSARKQNSEANLTDAALAGALNDQKAEQILGSDNSTAAKLFKTIRTITK